MDRGRFIAERVTPTVEGWALVGVVLLLAVGSGLVVFVGLGLVSWALGWTVRVALAGSGAVVLLAWVGMVARVDKLLTTTETVRPWGVDQVDALPAPVVTVEVSDMERGQMRFADLPGTVDQLGELARGLLAGRTFSEGDWTGKGRPFTRSQFRDLRGELLERGFLSWRRDDSPTQGVEVTDLGWQVFSGLADACASAYVRGGRALPLVDGRGKGGQS